MPNKADFVGHCFVQDDGLARRCAPAVAIVVTPVSLMVRLFDSKTGRCAYAISSLKLEALDLHSCMTLLSAKMLEEWFSLAITSAS